MLHELVRRHGEEAHHRQEVTDLVPEAFRRPPRLAPAEEASLQLFGSGEENGLRRSEFSLLQACVASVRTLAVKK